MRKNEILKRSYHIPLPMFDAAFRCFQKKFVMPMNLVFTVILLVLAGDFIYAAVRDPGNTTAYLLTVICLALILVRWYRMFKLRRSVHEALAEIEQDRYELTVYADGMTVRTEDAPKPAAEEAAAEKPEVTEEPEQSGEQGGGFQKLFPDEPAEDENAPKPTEIYFGKGVKLLEYPEFFMVYLVRSNFYVIPKKDFSEAEIQQLSELFAKNK